MAIPLRPNPEPMTSQTAQHILTELQERQTISAERRQEVERLVLEQGKELEEVLTVDRQLSPAQLADITAELFSLARADLTSQALTADILNLLTPKVAQHYQMVVFGRDAGTISVGLVDPGNVQAREAAEFLAQQLGVTPQFYVLTLADYRSALAQYAGFKKEIGSAIEVAEEKYAQQEAALVDEAGDLGDIVKSAPVAKIVSVIVKHALDGGASDIHIEPGIGESRVRFRVDGELHTTLTLPLHLHTAVVSRVKVLANLKIDETRLPQDGRIRIAIDGQDVDVRVSVLPMLSAEKVVMRVLNSSAGLPNLATLGYSQHHIDIIDRNIKKPYGLMLLTGPTGSGKTTTLYSVLNMLKADETNITTLEDPIEYYIAGINQSQVNTEIGYTFATGLRAILRQDPNIIMVGEIRDNETVELVTHAALTGHLVFSTLHTNNAWGSIPRLIDMHAEPFLLASIINVVMAQRLVRRICPDCKEPLELPAPVYERVAAELSAIPKENMTGYDGQLKFYHGRGCASCGQSGYAGRTVIGEVLEFDQELRNLIARDFRREEVQALLAKRGYITLVQDGLMKALQGQTSVEEVLRASQENAAV